MLQVRAVVVVSPCQCSFVLGVLTYAYAAPVIAPIAGGWIVSNSHLGWRWTEWVTLIISGAVFLLSFCLLPETYLPVLLDWKAAQLRRITKDDRYVSEHAESSSFIRRIKDVLPLPAEFFAKEPVIAVLGGYLILLYVLLFTFLSGFDYIFKETYQFSVEYTGSCFGSIAAGATAFTLLAPGLYSWARHKTEYRKGAQVEPEFISPGLAMNFDEAFTKPILRELQALLLP